jgi:chaperone modulatory protein CbpM
MAKQKLPVVSGFVLDETTTLTVQELSCACSVRVEKIVELVEEGILEPAGPALAEWRFPGTCLNRARAAVRLQRDLEVNLAGTALVLDLMDEVKLLRSRLERLESER